MLFLAVVFAAVAASLCACIRVLWHTRAQCRATEIAIRGFGADVERGTGELSYRSRRARRAFERLALRVDGTRTPLLSE